MIIAIIKLVIAISFVILKFLFRLFLYAAPFYLKIFSDYYSHDTDGDGMPDWWDPNPHKPYEE